MKKLLIVDDNAQNLYMLDIILKTNGFEVEQASNGAEALELAHQNPPEMVISDILMPIMDGFNLCRNWMADERLKRIPFIFYTATYTDRNDESFALSLGADRFLIKPTDPDDFLAVIQEVFKTHPTREQLVSPEPVQQEDAYYKEYSQVLIHKLEYKMMQLERTNRRLTALYLASCNLVKIKSSTELIHWILRDIVETAGYQQANYFHFDEKENKLFLLDAVGFSEESLTVFKDKLIFSLGEERGLVGRVAQSRQTINIADTSREPCWIVLDPTLNSALFVPVHYDNRLFGVIALFSVEKDAFSVEDEHNIAALANSLAVSIENRKVEEALRKSEFEYRLLADHMNDMVWLMDMNLKTLYTSPSVQKLLGYTVTEIEALPLEKQVTPTSLQKMINLFREAKGQAQVDPGCTFVQTTELEFYRQGGPTFWSETTFTLICDPNGQPVSILGEGRDITLQKQTMEKLKKSEERYRFAQQAAHIGSWEWDVLTDTLFWSDEMYSLFDKDPMRFTPTNAAVMDCIVPEDNPRTAKAVDDSFTKGLPFDVEYRITNSMGKVKWLHSMGKFVFSTLGQPLLAAGTIQDITEQKRSEEEIRKLNAELEQRVADRTVQLENSNKELEALAYSVSHDLRAPLRGIDGWSLVLLEDYGDQLDEKGHMYLERVRSETQRMGYLIEDLLELSRVTRIEMQIAHVDLSSLVHTIIARMQASQPDHSVEMVIQPGLSATGDAALLTIALTNLLDNAWKFTSKRPQARIEFGQMDVDSRETFFIRDNGVGFDMAFAHKLFGAFQRLHKAADFPGTGVGLATVQRIIHRHGGQVWVDAEVNQGATFFFTLGEIV
jgi:PAS domain S-box-containing protein